MLPITVFMFVPTTARAGGCASDQRTQSAGYGLPLPYQRVHYFTYDKYAMGGAHPNNAHRAQATACPRSMIHMLHLDTALKTRENGWVIGFLKNSYPSVLGATKVPGKCRATARERGRVGLEAPALPTRWPRGLGPGRPVAACGHCALRLISLERCHAAPLAGHQPHRLPALPPSLTVGCDETLYSRF